MSSEPEVIVRIEGRTGRLTLNRPQALHALTTGMCREMIAALSAWREDPAVELVLIDHSGERGFCAGGDIRTLAESGRGDGVAARDFFFTEYRLDHLLFHYPKPTVAVMDGVVMGGGVGLALASRYRVATERTVFAMPETGIGLFPDVGGSWYLARMPDHIGLWLALTGARLRAEDCLEVDIATHVVSPSDKAHLVQEFAHGSMGIAGRLSAREVKPARGVLPEVRSQVAALFRGRSLDEIIKDLQADGGEWACAQLDLLRARSPLSLRVAFRQLQEGAKANSFTEVMAMEYRIASRLSRAHDFLEGVRAVIVDKDNSPRWDPPTLEGVSQQMVDAVFAPLPAGQEWFPLSGDLP